ncbi:MAG: ATP-dependent metallopeptidase FtsH/Yme1/Tma family protein, partial [Paracoccaceae bacterium]
MGNNKNIAFWVILFLLMIALFNIFKGGGTTPNATAVSFSEFLDSVDAGQVDAVTLDGEKIYIRSGSNSFT